MTEPDPSGLLRRFASGDHAALELLYRTCADRAWNQARRMLGDGSAAEDAVQEAFLQLARTATKFDGRIPFGAWLGRLVHDAAAQISRSRQRRHQRESIVRQQQAIDSTADTSIDEDLIRSAVADLRPADQQAIDLHYFAGLDVAETAAAIGISSTATKVRLHRARQRLRDILVQRGVTAAQVALLLGALGSLAAANAPATVLAKANTLAGQAASGTLPTSTLPSTGLPAMAIAAGITVLLASGAALWVLSKPDVPPVPPAAVAPEPPPPAVATLEPGWRDIDARRLLHQADPTAEIAFGIDWQEVLRTGARSKPGTLFSDPRAAAWLAHMRQQCADYVVHKPEMPRWDRLIETSAGAVGSLTSAMGKQGRTTSSAVTYGLGSQAAEVLKAFGSTPPRALTASALLNNDATAAWQSFTTARDLDAISIPHRRLLAGDDPARVQSLEKAANQRPLLPAPIWAFWDASSTMAALDPDGRDPLGIGKWLGQGWQKRKPRFETTGWLTADGPLFRSNLRDLPLPLRQPAPALWRRWRAGAHASLALGFDALERYAAMLPLPPAVIAAAPAATGDLLIQMFPAAPFPTVVATLMRRGGDAPWRTLATSLALTADAAHPGTFAGFVGGVQLRMEIDAEAVVFTVGDATRLPAIGGAAPAPAALLAEADLANIGRTWLPLVWPMMQGFSETFEEIPLTDHHMWFELHRAVLDNESTGGHLSVRTLCEQRESREKQVRMENILPATRLDQLIAVVRNTPKPLFRYIVRFSDGWRIIDRQSSIEDDLAKPLDRARMRAAIAGTTRVAGVAPEDLEVMPLPPPPCLDHRWLPPLPVVIEHLPSWSLRIERVGDGVHCEERGLPLATAGLTYGLMQWPERLIKARQVAEYARELPIIEKRHAARIAALREIDRQYLSSAKLRLPNQLSELVADRAILAPWFDGHTPSAAQIDALGTYSSQYRILPPINHFTGAGFYGGYFAWVVPLESGWNACLGNLANPSMVVVNLPMTRIADSSTPSPSLREEPEDNQRGKF